MSGIEMHLTIGGIALHITSNGHAWELPSAYKNFVARNGKPPAQTINVCAGAEPFSLEGLARCTGHSGWSLYHNAEGQPIFAINGTASSGYLKRVAVFAPDFGSAQVYVQPKPREGADPPGLFPLEYPLDKLAMTNLLAQGYGVLLHAAAVIERGKAIVFAGPSGAGKSTLSRLYDGRPGVTVLNDDAVIIRLLDGQYQAFGTPWCGATPVCSPAGAPIKQIYVIEHAPENFARPLGPLEAVSVLLSRALIPFYRPEAIEFTLDFMSGLGQAVPCSRLGFVPDASVVAFVRQAG